MRAGKIYFPIDRADIFRLPEPARQVPSLLVEETRKRAARGLLISAGALALLVLVALLVGGLPRMGAAVLLGAVAGVGWSRRAAARRRPGVWRDGELVLARVLVELEAGPTEICYVEKEKDMSSSGEVGVFAGDPSGVFVRVEYEYGGRIRERRLDLEGKPVAVRVGDKLGCGVLVLPSAPDQPLLVTQRLARATLRD